ncbi:acyl-CoA dehydrogenase [Streptomyces qinzhouensis]|uniref:Acyl-CoA dehydrogenase n=1 Tax=Streptomyces qinzhouensis TaxID=2599401 RepID=A0A5B8J5I6_9ACTN|nr:acyl-CoA dehydrogenase [Streptomyces qinzhouensis]QDY76537.1 acyl-CoA dehydrogenase [Streptomyces qinzhouensis]
MGIGITHEHQELARSVRGWLTRAVPPEEVRKPLDAPRPAGPPGRPAHWDGAAAQGLLGIHLPEEYGGGGGTLLELAVALEETGAALLPGPYPGHALAAEVLHRAGQRDLAAALADGRRVAAAAFGPGGLTAVREPEGGLVVDGTAPPVLAGGHADLLLIAAATADGTVWAAADAAAFTVRVHESADPTRPTAEVTAAAVRVPAARVLDPAAVDSGLVRDLAAVLLAAEACGVAARALTTAVEHAKVREQFGSPIGRFQAVKHLCATMLIGLERSRALTWDAAKAAAPGAGSPPARALTAAFAAATALDTAYTNAKDCIQILGGTGFTWEHDAHLLLRRAVVARQLIGAGDDQLLRAARLAAAGARRELRTELPPEATGYRERVRTAIAAARGLDPVAARRALAPSGLAAPHLPPPYGLGAGPVEQLAVQRELAAAGVRLSGLSIAAWVVPSLLAHGTPEQRERLVPGTLRGELRWCQLFSEPGAGSDLAALTTRAERTPDGSWRITGQKVWTSAAHKADYGILLARTDPEAPRHRRLTYFVVDLRACEGVTIRPLREITGDSVFNEVWFDGTPLPADAVVGEVGDGWRVARNTLGNERVHMADEMSFDSELEALLAAAPGLDGARRARIGALAAEAHALNCMALRTTLRRVSGLEPGPGASVRKLVQTLHQQKTAELGLELLGPAGAVCEGPGEAAVRGLLMSRCLTIAGGTTQVQLNVVAERILGLPRD